MGRRPRRRGIIKYTQRVVHGAAVVSQCRVLTLLKGVEYTYTYTCVWL